jgi:hypothetical protein
MSSRPWLRLALVLGVVTAVPSAAWSQSDRTEDAFAKKVRRSHDLELLPRFAGDPESLLKQRVLGKRPEDLAELLKKYNVKPETIEKMLNDPSWRERLKNFDPTDKNIPEPFRNMLKGLDKSRLSNAEQQLSNERLQQIRDSLKKSQQSESVPPVTSGPQPEGTPNGKPNPAMMQGGPPQPPPMGQPDTPAREERDESPESSSDNPQANSPLTRGLLKVAERLRKLDPSLSHSPALNRAVQELNRHMGDEDARWKKLAGGANAMQEKWTGVSQTLHLDRLWPKNGLSWPRALTPSSLPNVNLRLGPPGERPSLGTLRSVGSAQGGSASGWRTLLGVAGLAVLAFVFWKLLGRPTGTDERTDAAAWRLGPWPVQPAAVRTREELIRAFEYLSLLCLGPEARHWNHRVIAEQLGEGSQAPAAGHIPSGGPPLLAGPDVSERRHAAEELAALYEQARYAPAVGPLPDEALADARRDLCLLAKVATA